MACTPASARAAATRGNGAGCLDRCGFVAQRAIEDLNTRRHGGPGESFPLEGGGAAPADGSHAMKFEIQLTGTGGKRKHVVELEQKGEGRTMALDGQPIDAAAGQIEPNADA